MLAGKQPSHRKEFENRHQWAAQRGRMTAASYVRNSELDTQVGEDEQESEQVGLFWPGPALHVMLC